MLVCFEAGVTGLNWILNQVAPAKAAGGEWGSGALPTGMSRQASSGVLSPPRVQEEVLPKRGCLYAALNTRVCKMSKWVRKPGW